MMNEEATVIILDDDEEEDDIQILDDNTNDFIPASCDLEGPKLTFSKLRTRGGIRRNLGGRVRTLSSAAAHIDFFGNKNKDRIAGPSTRIEEPIAGSSVEEEEPGPSKPSLDSVTLMVSNRDGDPEQSNSNTKKDNVNKKSATPLTANGYSKPYHSFPQLITQVLASCPEHCATALEICELLALKQPYFRFCPNSSWKGAIYSALTKRKKFFKIVRCNADGEYVWTFNPQFEQYMLQKWVPRYLKNKSFPTESNKSAPSSAIVSDENSSASETGPVIVSVNSLTQPSSDAPSEASSTPRSYVDLHSKRPVILSSGGLRPISSCKSLTTLSPIIVSSESLSAESNPNAGPEFVLEDPIFVNTDSANINEEPNHLWEPEITLSELNGDPMLPPPRSVHDFSMLNIYYDTTVSKEEANYRRIFEKEHVKVEKFRLHCTVCDCHLGTSGQVAQHNIRLHPTLAVLTCQRCYHQCKKCIQLSSESCSWCAKSIITEVQLSCSICLAKFCKPCVEHNFGPVWSNRMKQKKDWICFLCDQKQIWPHRAIAAFLLQHYSKILRMKRKEMSQSSVPLHTASNFPFFSQDLSTCCKKISAKDKIGELLNKLSVKPSTAIFSKDSSKPMGNVQPAPPSQTTESSVSVEPESAVYRAPSISVSPVPSSKHQLFIVEENSPSHIYVQSTAPLPSVTLNTGTQYIHNVYPDKNYVVMQSPTEIRSSAPTYLQVTTSQTQSSENIPVSSEIVSPRPNHHVPPKRTYGKPLQLNATSPSTAVATNNDLTCNNITKQKTCDEKIVSDSPRHSPLSTEGRPLKILSDREKIERRPMPKSKKQTLLRTVLMNESIESMKRHFQSVDSRPDKTPSVAISDETKTKDSLNNLLTHQPSDERNVEEPILKSIIQSATERLMNLQKKQTSHQSLSDCKASNEAEVIINLDDHCLDSKPGVNHSNFPVGQENTKPSNPFPKIKIRTLEELQGHKTCNETELNIPNTMDKPREVEFFPEVETLNSQSEVDLPKEVNVTELKQGIIEASRVLVSTQKKFKELAKVISSNLSYKTKQATELVNKFQEILKCCRSEIDVIDNNINNRFGYLNQTVEVALKQKKRRIKKSRIHEKKLTCLKGTSLHESAEQFRNQNVLSATGSSNVSELNVPSQSQEDDFVDVEGSSVEEESPVKRKRDLVDFNPLGKKTILGTPEITKEDLERIPSTWDANLTKISGTSNNQSFMNELIQRQQLIRKAGRKKCIWETRCRKKKKHKVKDGSVHKKRGMKPNPWRWRDTSPKHCSLAADRCSLERLRKRVKKPSIPLRLSERRHASTVEYVARALSPGKDEIIPTTVTASFPMNYVIKPCSVVVHKLSPRIVQLLQKRF